MLLEIQPRRNFEASKNAQWHTGLRAGGINGIIGSIFEEPQSLGTHAPFGKAVLPELRRCGSELVRSFSFSFCIVFIDPWPEIFCPQLRELQEHIGHITLGVDQQDGDPVEGSFLEQADTESGFAAAGHSDTNGMGCQVPRIILNCFFRPSPGCRIEFCAQVKRTEFFFRWMHG